MPLRPRVVALFAPRMACFASLAPRAQVVLNIFGKNRTGLVHDVTGIVYSSKGNLQESRMDRVGDYFSMLSMVTLEGDADATEAASALQAALVAELNEGVAEGTEGALIVSARPSSSWQRPQQGDIATITVMGNEQRGIVKEVTSVFAQHGVDIVTASSEVLAAPFSSRNHAHARICF